MTDRPVVTLDDIERLISELNAKDEDSYQDWFEEKGIDKEVEKVMIEWAKKGMVDLFMEAATHDARLTKVAVMEAVVATFLISGFTMGWEAHEQFGGERVGLEGDDEAHLTNHP